MMLTKKQVDQIASDPKFLDQLTKEEVKTYIYSRGFYDHAFFIDYFLGHMKEKPRDEWTEKDDKEFASGGKPKYKTPKFHLDILEAYNKDESVCSIFYRGAGKTSLLIISDLHDILYAEHKSMKEILTISTNDNKNKILKTIREEIEENEKIEYIFGDQQPSQKSEERNKYWNNSDLYFRNGVKYHGRSTGGVIRGVRANKINVDDPQENKDVRNKKVADEMYWWFNTSVMGATDVNYKIIVQGTDLGEDCLVRRIMDGDSKEFNRFSMPAIENCVLDGAQIIKGESIWEDRYTIEWFQRKIDTIGRPAFEQEYLNISKHLNSDPVFEENIVLSVKDPIREVNGFTFFVEPDKARRLSAGIDTASGESRDKSAISVRYEDTKELVATLNTKLSLEELAAKIDWWFTEGYYVNVIPETNFSDYFIALLREYWWFGTYCYRQMRELDDIKGKLGDYGFRTTTKTKGIIVDIYGRHLRDNNKLLATGQGNQFIVSAEIAQQIKYYERDGNKMNARSGQYDDLLMADMICLYGIESSNYRL